MASRGYGWPCSVLEPAVQRSIFLVLFAAACSSSALEPSPGPEPTTPIEAQEGPALASSKDNSATVVAVVPRRSWSRGAAQGRFVRHSIRRITVHHTAAPWQLETDGSSRVRQHLEHHRGKGWPDIAYHYVVAGDGTVFEGRPIDTVGDTSTAMVRTTSRQESSSGGAAGASAGARANTKNTHVHTLNNLKINVN